jgi:methylated-DNA-[protein]-cysteine S-methyltransferase
MTSYSILKTSEIGDLFLVADETHLLAVYFNDSHEFKPLANGAKLNPNQKVLKQASKEIQEYLRGKRTEFTVPMRNQGTPFQKKVWKRIAMIPFGKTVSYSDLARYAGSYKAVRAAGTATGMNPRASLVPCHRVISKNGGIGGYAGGLDRKRQLLGIESINLKSRSARAMSDGKNRNRLG